MKIPRKTKILQQQQNNILQGPDIVHQNEMPHIKDEDSIHVNKFGADQQFVQNNIISDSGSQLVNYKIKFADFGNQKLVHQNQLSVTRTKNQTLESSNQGSVYQKKSLDNQSHLKQQQNQPPSNLSFIQRGPNMHLVNFSKPAYPPLDPCTGGSQAQRQEHLKK